VISLIDTVVTSPSTGSEELIEDVKEKSSTPVKLVETLSLFEMNEESPSSPPPPDTPKISIGILLR
jgi:hypothetical protein